MLQRIKQYIAHILSVLAVLLAGGAAIHVATSPPRLGAQTSPAPCKRTGSQTWQCSVSTEWQSCDAGTTVTCTPQGVQELANASIERTAMLVDWNSPDASDCDGGPCDAVMRRYFPAGLRNGSFRGPAGATSGTQIDESHDSYWAGEDAGIAYCADAGVPCGKVYCPSAGYVGCMFDIDYRQAPVAPAVTPQITAVSQTVAATVYASPLSLTYTCAPAGCGIGATAATFNGVALTGVSGASTSITGTLPAGTYTAGSTPGTATATTSTHGLLPYSGVSFAQSAVQSISPATGPLAGGTAVTITLNAGATGGCSTVPTLCNSGSSGCVNTTGCSVVDDLHITATSGSNTSGTGNVNVTSPSSPTPGTNLWTYQNPPAPTISYVYTDIGDTGMTMKVHGTSMTGVTSCSVGGQTQGTVVVDSATDVHFAIPSGVTVATASDVVCTNAGGASTGGTGLYYAMPTGIVGLWTGSPCHDAACQGLGFLDGLSNPNAAPVATVLDWAATAHNAAQATSANRWQTLSSNYNSSGRTAAVGTNVSGMVETASSFPTTADPVTFCFVGDNTINVAAGAYFIAGNASFNTRMYAANTGSLFQLADNATQVNSPTFATGATHLFCGVSNGASSFACLDATCGSTGSVGATGITSGGINLGNVVGGGSPLIGKFALAAIWNRALSSSEITTQVRVIMHVPTNWNTP